MDTMTYSLIIAALVFMPTRHLQLFLPHRCEVLRPESTYVDQGAPPPASRSASPGAASLLELDLHPGIRALVLDLLLGQLEPNPVHGLDQPEVAQARVHVGETHQVQIGADLAERDRLRPVGRLASGDGKLIESLDIDQIPGLDFSLVAQRARRTAG